MEKLQWVTKKVKVKDLVKLDFNPRKITAVKQKKLLESLNKFNLVEIPAINTDYKIIGGNQRITALLLAGRGDEEIDVRFPNRKLTEIEVKEYSIISNTHAGEFDFEVLDLEFSEIDLPELGFDILGLDEWIIKKDKLLADKAYEDDYIIPEELDVDVVLGDLIEIGEHRLLCGSSTDVNDIAKLMNGSLADMVLTDPPYNVNYTGATKDALTIKNDSMTNDDFYKFLYDFYTALGSFTKKGGAWYVWHADSEGANFRQAMKDSGILLKQCLIWLKSSMVLGRQDYQWRHEPCLGAVNAESWEWIKEHEPCLYGWREGGSHFWKGGRKQTTILEFDKPNRNGEHPTMKPILLFGLQIGNSSKVGEIVSDGFLGSGATMVASHQLDRKCYAMELDPKYCQVTIDRMLKLDNTLNVKINGKDYIKKI